MSSKGIIGMDSLLRKLEALGSNSADALVQSMDKNIKLVEGEAKFLAPVDIGDLRNSISSKTVKKAKAIQGIVYTNSDHAAYMEFGTGQKGASSPSPPKDPDSGISYREDWAGVPAQPYMYPALKNQEQQVLENIKNDLRAAIRRAVKK